jgi:hypothetical protein
MAIGMTGPPPSPCRMRKKISALPLQAKPQRAELTTNIDRLMNSRLRLPMTLPSQPTVGTMTAPAIM